MVVRGYPASPRVWRTTAAAALLTGRLDGRAGLATQSGELSTTTSTSLPDVAARSSSPVPLFPCSPVPGGKARYIPGGIKRIRDALANYRFLVVHRAVWPWETAGLRLVDPLNLIPKSNKKQIRAVMLVEPQHSRLI